MGGNVTQEGVKLDLEWMKRVGIGGVTKIDAAFEGWGALLDTPQCVERPLAYLSPEWREALRYSVELADALGLEFCIDSSPGFSLTGGPWVQPHQAMKKLVWSETWLQGGQRFTGALAKPPETTGPFQNIPWVALGSPGIGDSHTPIHYADVATVAFRAPRHEIPFASLEPTITTSAGPIDGASLYNGDLAESVTLPFGEGPHAWIQFAFKAPQRICGVTAVLGRPLTWDPRREAGPRGWLEASDDGQLFRKIAALPNAGALQQTVSFPATIARIFRVVLERPAPSVRERLGLAAPLVGHQIAELVLHTAARVNRFEDKAGYSTRQILAEDDTTPVAQSDVVSKQDIIDLTSRMRLDGSLDWTPPEGRWIVLRFGSSLISLGSPIIPPRGRPRVWRSISSIGRT
jgi:hypothetical protein